jgi:hypothetical protein
MTASPHECPTASTRPGNCWISIATYALSTEMPRSGLAAATTETPFACRRSITPLQLELSANAP